MKRILLSDYDFSKKRVRYKGEVQTKFDLSYAIGEIDPLSCYAIYPDAYRYDEYATYLKSKLEILSEDGFKSGYYRALEVISQKLLKKRHEISEKLKGSKKPFWSENLDSPEGLYGQFVALTKLQDWIQEIRNIEITKDE